LAFLEVVIFNHLRPVSSLARQLLSYDQKNDGRLATGSSELSAHRRHRKEIDPMTQHRVSNWILLGMAGIALLAGAPSANAAICVYPQGYNPPTCDQTVFGTNGADTIYGTALNDCIFGLGGNDYLTGANNGDDWLVGGSGDDQLYGGGGNDLLDGSEGNDFLSGDSGNDSLWGYTGNDVLLGGSGSDLLCGEDGDDELYGGNNGSNYDILGGGPGNDKCQEGEETYDCERS
jgi:Ca2+-binding RTX toxin-like protein